jgi:hypothetical protein
MKTEKMSFKNIKDVLTRDEMKSIMAGSGTSSWRSACYNGNTYWYICYTSGTTTTCNYAYSRETGCYA